MNGFPNEKFAWIKGRNVAGQSVSTWVYARIWEQNSAWSRGLLGGGLVFIALFLTRAAEQTRDSLVYAQAAKTGVEMFHPHHLLYTPAVRLFYLAARTICPGCDAILAGQIHNILWVVIGGVALFYLVRSVWNTRAALAIAVLFLSLRGTWELSTQTTMYAPSAAILALTSAALVTRGGRLQAGGRMLVAALFALAILYHQANVLFLLPLGVYLVASAGGKQGFRTWLWVTGLAGLAALANYLAVYLASVPPRSISGFIRFCLAYTSEICLGGLCKTSPEGWGSLANLSPEGLRQLLSSLFWNIMVLPERIEALILPGFGLALLGLIGWHTVQLWRGAGDRALRLFCLAWFVAYTGFFFWWLPSYQHPFITAFVPLTLLTLLLIKDLSRRVADPGRAKRVMVIGVALTALVLAGRNYQARILPLSQSRGDAYVEAAELNAAAPESCVLLTSYGVWNNLRYYFDHPAAIQAKHPLSYFFLDEPLTPEYRIDSQPCIFVATTFLMPTYVDEDYSDDPVDAYQTPERWLAYLSWLLDIEYEQPGLSAGPVTSRDFTVVRFSEGAPYLRLLPERRSAVGLDDLFQQLDAEIDMASRPFQTWYTAVLQ